MSIRVLPIRFIGGIADATSQSVSLGVLNRGRFFRELERNSFIVEGQDIYGLGGEGDLSLYPVGFIYKHVVTSVNGFEDSVKEDYRRFLRVLSLFDGE